MVRLEERRRGHDRPVRPAKVGRAQRLAFFRWQGFRQQFPAGQPQCCGRHDQKGKNRTPAEKGLQPATDHRGDGWRQCEHHRHLRHQALGSSAIKQVADNGPADDDAGAGRHALHRAPEPQVLDACGERAARRGDGEQTEGDKDDVAAAKAVRNGAMPQGHQRERKQIDGQRLLDFEWRGVEFFTDFVERRQIGVDGKRSKCRQ